MQVNKNIVKLSKGVFSVATPYIPNSQLILDFNPFINKLINEGFFIEDCKLIHYQAKPKYDRTWGLYEINNDTYSDLLNFNFSNLALMRDLTFDERIIKTKPHAVVLIKPK